MTKMNVGVFDCKAGLVYDEQYKEVLGWLTMHATKRIFASVFIVDILPADDEDTSNAVINMLLNLRRASQRGVDVRLIIGGSSENLSIQDVTEAAMVHCRRLHIPCQLMAAVSSTSSHKKLVVVDDYVLVGSHNWSSKAFACETQDSVLIADPRLAAFLADELAVEWRALVKEAQDATV